MAQQLNYAALLNYLEESFNGKKNEIKPLNKYCKGEKSFLYGTFDVRQVCVKNGVTKYIAIIFQDLPSPTPGLISEKIKTYVTDNKLDFEYITWDNYKTYMNINPMF
ncbi:MAG TPA: hypothetical protein VIJ92_15490 [Ginsengibacter sp.]